MSTSKLENEFSKYKILIADDNEVEQEVLAHTVSSLGIQFDMVNDGDELITRLMEVECGTYDLVLTDIYMPGKNGYDVCREYRASQRKDASTLPFIGISADNDPQLFETAVNAGMNGMTNKPATKRALAAYFTLLLSEGTTNLAFAARVQNHIDELNHLRKELARKKSSGADDSDASRAFIRHLKRIRLVFFACLLLLACFFLLVYKTAVHNRETRRDMERNYQLGQEYHEARNLFRKGSDLLTAYARRYAVTKDMEFVRLYFREVHEERHRDKGIQMMRELPNAESFVQELDEHMKLSNELMDVECHAMKLVALSRGEAEENLPPELRECPLTEEELALPPEAKRDRGMQMLFDDNYQKFKDDIVGDIESSLNAAIDQKSLQFQELAKELGFMHRLEAVFIILLLFILLIFFIFIYYLYRLRIVAQEKTALEEAMKERDRAIAAERAKSYFFASISHDIRTPLNSILGFSQLLLQGGQTEDEKRQFLNSIISSSNQLLDLINDLLDMARLETGRLELKPAPFSTRKLVEEIVLAFRPLVTQNNLTLSTNLPEEDSFPVLDRGRLHQVLVNLVGNAVKFTKAGGITITQECDKKQNRLVFRIKDTGRGISPQNLAKLMKPFTQLSHVDRTQGTGLGLAISRQILGLMNGFIQVQSKVGVGSEFSVILEKVTFSNEKNEVTKAPAAAAAEQKGADGMDKEAAGRLKVLLVDDVQLNLVVIKQMLKTFGVTRTATALSGRQAVEKLENETFDLVLTDISMPEMGGDELVRVIRSDPRWKSIPAYGVTGDVEVIKRCHSIGFSGILLKPLTIQNLAEILKKIAVPRGQGKE